MCTHGQCGNKYTLSLVGTCPDITLDIANMEHANKQINVDPPTESK